jgi:hypothetical protein
MLQNYWQPAFLPWSWPEGLLWVGESIADFFVDTAGLVVGLALPLSVFGAVVLGRQRGKLAALLLLPFGFALAAAALHKYPFQDRLVLFLAPVAIGLTAQGAGALAQICARRWERYKRLVWVFLCLLVLGTSWDSVRWTTKRVFDSRPRDHIRPLLVEMKEAWQPGDRLYVYRHAWAPYRYYQGRLGLGDLDWVRGRADRRHAGLYKNELRLVRGARRVWLLALRTSRQPIYDCPNEHVYILKLFARLGPRLRQHEATGASLTLFEVER